MSEITDLLGCAQDWTPVSLDIPRKDPPDCGLRHVSGMLLHVWDCETTWVIQDAHEPQPVVARIKKTIPAPDAFPKTGAGACLRDLDVRYGSCKQAQLSQVVRSISLYALAKGIRAQLYITRDNDTQYAGCIQLYDNENGFTGDAFQLPEDLNTALSACAGVLILDTNTDCLALPHALHIDLPTTAHGVMAFLHQARQDA